MQIEGTGEESEMYSANATLCKYCMIGVFWVLVGKQSSVFCKAFTPDHEHFCKKWPKN